MQIQQEKDKMKLPDGRTCNHCAHTEHCKWLFGISGNETVCSIYPPRFYDDVMTIYHRDGTTTEVLHPFDAMRKREIHNHADISGEISTDVKNNNPEYYNQPSESDVSTTQNVCSWIQEDDPEINL